MAADCLVSTPRDRPSTSPLHTPSPSQPSDSPKRDASCFPNPSAFLPGRRPPAPSKRRARGPQKDTAYMELHQSTCLNLNGSDSSDSDLWILPDFEDWEYDDASPLAHPASNPLSLNLNMKRDGDGRSEMAMAMPGQSEWAPLVQRAASSNRERLRRRLEGDGWDFVGGKYGYGNGEESWIVNRGGSGSGSSSEESVDEEFDVVILLPAPALALAVS